jgi:hypothetical protein
MQADIQTAMMEIEAEPFHKADGDRPLPVDRERPRRRERRGRARLALDDPRQKVGQKTREVGEDDVDLVRPAVGLVFVEQRVVRRQAEALRLRRRRFANQREQSGELR